MDNERNQQRFESVYSKKVRAGKRRTYFFDVRRTKGDDFYLTLTESTRRFNGDGYERHKLFLYKEDFNRFLSGLEEAINFVKTDLLPDYDYDEYTRRQEEWEAQKAAEAAAEAAGEPVPVRESTSSVNIQTTSTKDDGDDEIVEDDMSW